MQSGGRGGVKDNDTVEPNLLRYVWRHSRSDQIVILLLTIGTFPLLYFSLELPKIIINDAIAGTGFPKTIFGYPFEQTPYLLILCCTFFVTVIIINIFKWFMNVKVGMTGERMLRRLRFSLFGQVMRFPPQRFKEARPGEVVQSIMGEVEPIGGFIGEIIATPIYQGGMLIVYVTFIFVQDPALGLAALALYPIQVAIIPRLQRKIVRLNRERAGNTRRLADTLAGAVGGIDDIRANGAERWHMSQISGRLHTNTDIRQQLFKRKFTIKFINNLLNQLTPFLFFSIGGAMVIAGRLDLGALVAVLSAYKDISKPWREIMSFQQRWTDFKGRFAYAVENFGGHDLAPTARLEAEADAAIAEGGLSLDGVEVGEGAEMVAARSLTVAPGQTLALADGDSGARVALLRVAAGVDAPARGVARVGAQDLSRVSAATLGAAVGYVAADPALLDATIRDNMIYGLLRQPATLAEPASREARYMRDEASRTGAPPFDPHGDWVDYAAAGVPNAAALDQRLVELADAAGMGGELAAAALGARIDAAGGAPLLRALMGVRGAAAAALAEQKLANVIEPWDRAAYCDNAALLENLLFALPLAAAADDDPLMATLKTPAIARVLKETGAEALLADVGADIARELAEIAAALGEDSAALDQLGGYGRSDAATAVSLAPRLPVAGSGMRKGGARRAVVALGARFTASRDGFDVLGPARRARALDLRAACASRLADMDGVGRFDDPTPPAFFTVAEVLSGGRRRLDRRTAWRRLDAALETAATEGGLRPILLVAGLLRPAGPGGSRLSIGMRRRVALLRALVKRPQALVLAGAFGGGAPEDRAMRQLARQMAPQAAILLSADDASACEDADMVARIDGQGVATLDAPAPQPDLSDARDRESAPQ